MHAFVVFLLTSVPFANAINCRVCANRDFLGATIFTVLQQLGADKLFAPAGNCSDTNQICASTTYCFKREDYYEILDGSLGSLQAHYYSRGCDINAVAGSSVAYRLGECVKYEEATREGYKVTRKICACNDKEQCNSSPIAFSTVSSLLTMLATAVLLH